MTDDLTLQTKDPQARRIAWLALVVCLGLRTVDIAPALAAFVRSLF